MTPRIFSRRDVCRLALVSCLAGLSGCSINVKESTLASYEGFFPDEMIKELPAGWRYKPLVSYGKNHPYAPNLIKDFDLLALNDGWISDLPIGDLQLIKENPLSGRLNNQANLFLKSLNEELSEKVFPLFFSPWVMVFRNGELWMQEASRSWEILFSDKLEGQIVFPKSPRFLISLLDQMGRSSQLKKLRKQALTFDDRNGLNWVTSGRARVAILPLHVCLKSIFKDPRLSIAWPSRGAPLNWTILVRPKASRSSIPIPWVQDSWSLPIVRKLLLSGWIPPISYADLLKARDSIPDKYQAIILPSEEVFENSWSLQPLSLIEKEQFSQRWIKAEN